VYGASPAEAPLAARSEADLRRDLADLCRRMAQGGYVVATDGNVSARLGDGRLLVTPSGAAKGELGPADFVLANERGEPLDPATRVSSEVRLHVAVYEERPEVRVVCHAHPPTAVAFSLAGIEVASCILPEIVIAVGELPTAPYATPTTQAAADVVRPLVRGGADAVILDRHGSVTLARDARAAFWLLERLEWAARVTLMARQLGGVQKLPKGEVERLLEVRAKLSGKPRREPCNACGACVAGTMAY
jgi:L-fuculose-phosphate aldolase